jgi:hypothetical protein
LPHGCGGGVVGCCGTGEDWGLESCEGALNP